MPNRRATERLNAKGFKRPRGRPEELWRMGNNRKDSPVREGPKRGKSKSVVEERTEEEETLWQGTTGIAGVEEGLEE